jgi:hypothetical protein
LWQVLALHGTCERVEVSGNAALVNVTDGKVFVPIVNSSVTTRSGKVTRMCPRSTSLPTSAITLVVPKNAKIGAIRMANCKFVTCSRVGYVKMSYVGAFLVAGVCDGVKTESAHVFVQCGIVRETVLTTSGDINLIKVGSARSTSGSIQVSEVENATTTSGDITVTKSCVKAASTSGDICVPTTCQNAKTTHGFITYL